MTDEKVRSERAPEQLLPTTVAPREAPADSESDGAGLRGPPSAGGRAVQLRRRAENLTREREVHEPPDRAPPSPEETQRTLHELHLHQIELEMQNEELRRAQLELEAAKARYFELYELAPVGYCTVDEEGVILEGNLTLASLLGMARVTPGRHRIRRLIAAADQDVYYQHSKQLLETRSPQACELQLVRQDGSIFWAQLRSTVAEDAAGATLFRVVVTDITELKQAVAELRAKDQQLVLQNRQAALGEMLDYIAHQWRQPLNVLGLLLFTLRSLSRRGELDEAAVEDTVVRGTRLVEKMSSTITDFHDFFRPHKDRQVFSVLAKLRETVALVEPSYRHVGIGLEIEAAGDLWLLGVANEYSQVLMNLLANARQAIMAAGVAQGKVTLDLGSRDGLACLTVRDNGGGIPPAVFEKLFERYFTTRVEGTGLGLYMSRQIVEQSFGGRLEARNVDGGAEFAVLTPLAPGAVSE